MARYIITEVGLKVLEEEGDLSSDDDGKTESSEILSLLAKLEGIKYVREHSLSPPEVTTTLAGIAYDFMHPPSNFIWLGPPHETAQLDKWNQESAAHVPINIAYLLSKGYVRVMHKLDEEEEEAKRMEWLAAHPPEDMERDAAVVAHTTKDGGVSLRAVLKKGEHSAVHTAAHRGADDDRFFAIKDGRLVYKPAEEKKKEKKK